MQVIFYNYGGKGNTVVKLLPTATATYEGTLRQGVSLLSPSRYIEEHSFDKLRFVNYAYIKDFDRYYFVTNISVATEGLIQIDRKEDLLMTYQGIVKKSHGIVKRTSCPKYYSKWYPDDMRPASGQYYKQTFALGGNTKDSFGSFLTNNKGNDMFLYTNDGNPLAVKYYVVYTTSTELTQTTGTVLPAYLKEVLYHYTSGQTSETVSTTEGMGSGTMRVVACNFKAIAKLRRWANSKQASSAVVSVFYIPFGLTHDETPVPSITVGKGDADSVISFDSDDFELVYTVSETEVRKLFDVTVSSNLLESNYSYSKWKLQKDKRRIWLPFSGWYDLNIMDLALTEGDARIQCFYVINPFKGTATIYVTNYTTKRVIYTTDVTISVTVPLLSSNEQANQDALNKSITTSVISGFLSLSKLIALVAIPEFSVPMRALGGATAVGGIYNAVANPILTNNSLHDQEQVSNFSANSYNYRYLDPILEYTIYPLAFTDTSYDRTLYIQDNGLPSNDNRNIDNLYYFQSGEKVENYFFQMTDVTIPMTDGEKHINTDELATLKSLLMTGVYTQDVQA